LDQQQVSLELQKVFCDAWDTHVQGKRWRTPTQLSSVSHKHQHTMHTLMSDLVPAVVLCVQSSRREKPH
jgi:hypothetical protein